MAKTITARGQITIVDLNDAKQVQVYLQNSGADTQLYNPDDKSYTPDYANGGAITITPMVFVTGIATTQISQCSDFVYSITDDGKTYTLDSTTTSVTGYSMGANGVLTIKKNMTGNSLVIRFSCTYTDPDTKITTELKCDKTLIRSSSAGALFQAIITAPNGNIFQEGMQNSTLTAVCTPYRGTTADTSGSTFTWYKMNISTGKWEEVTVGVSKASNVSTLSVTIDDVDNFQTFKCVITDDGDSAEALITFQDLTDPYQVEVMSTTGDKIVNGEGSTTVFARVWRSGELIESETTATANRKFTYTWTKYDKDGNQTDWDGTTSPQKTGNPITVYAADVDTRCTIWCEVTKA